MKVLLTGATGFLGSHLAHALVEQGHEVVIIKRSFSKTCRIDKLMPRLSVYDLDQNSLNQAFEDSTIDVVIHTATSYGRSNESAAEMLETNSLFPLRLLEVAAAHHTPLFINTGTSLSSSLNAYALSKDQFRAWGQQFAEAERIQFISIKLEHMYGPSDDDSKFTTYVIKSCLGNTAELKLTAGEQKRDFIYVEDVISAYLCLLKHAHAAAYIEFELGTGVAPSIREFVVTVHTLTRSSAKLSFGAIPYRQAEVMMSLADIRPLKQLGWQPSHSLEQGLQKTIAWYDSRRGRQA